jgi:steroid delta-isomerase-like uncharacterized protein
MCYENAVAPSMTAEQNKETVRRFLEEVWGARDAAAVDKYVARDAAFRDQTSEAPGNQAVKNAVAAVAAGMPDYRLEIETLVADGDTVGARWTCTGTNTGQLYGLPPSHRTGSFVAMAAVRLEDGKIVEGWQVLDVFGLLGQLGMIEPGKPPPAPVRWMIALKGKRYARSQARAGAA